MNEKAGLPIIPDSREDDLYPPPQAPADSLRAIRVYRSKRMNRPVFQDIR